MTTLEARIEGRHSLAHKVYEPLWAVGAALSNEVALIS